MDFFSFVILPLPLFVLVFIRISIIYVDSVVKVVRNISWACFENGCDWKRGWVSHCSKSLFGNIYVLTKKINCWSECILD